MSSGLVGACFWWGVDELGCILDEGSQLRLSFSEDGIDWSGR